MTLDEYQKYMDDENMAYWTSFYIIPTNKRETKPLTKDLLPSEINQIDFIGLSIGNESLMIDLTVWAGDIDNPIKITSKMLGSNINKCFYLMREILSKVKTTYYSVNSNM